MARTKTTRRTYTNKKLQATGNLTEAESERVEEPLNDIGLSQPQAGLHGADIKCDTIPDPKEPVVLPEEISLQEPLQGCGLNQPQAGLPTTDIKSDTIPDSPEPVVLPEQILMQEPLQDVGLSQPQAGLPTADIQSDTIPNPVEPEIVSEDIISLQNSPILDCSFVSRQRQKSGSTLDQRPISPFKQENSPILGCSQRNVTSSLPTSIAFRPISDTHNGGTSFVSPIHPNSWDSSIKENSELQANIRPVTPDISNIPVDDIFSPRTQKELRSTILALFPNGPPPPPPVKPLRRRKKGDKPYIVGCTKRRRVPSPKGLSVFRGDDYGITDKTNCDEEEPCSPAKKSRRAPRGTASLSKSRFNPLSDEIAERLKLFEKIDRLLGRTPKEETVGYMSKRSKSRTFSPIPSTSTDSETIMKNDRHFSESLNCDNDSFDIDDDDDDDLPEIVWETKTSNCKQENITYDCNESPLALLNKHNITDFTRDINYNDECSPVTDTDDCNYDDPVELDEDLNNNNNNDDVISIDDDYCEIDFDKLIPKEKLIMNDVEEIDVKPKTEPEIVGLKDGYSSAPQRIIPTTSNTDVICIDDDVNAVTNTVTKESNVSTNGDGTNVSATQELASTATSSVLRASNKIPVATEATPDLVIEVPDVSGHTVNTLFDASANRRPIWNEEVEFVSETRTNEPRLSNSENRENNSDVQFVSNIQSNVNTGRKRSYEIRNELKQFFAYLSDTSIERQRKPAKRKNKKPKRQPCHTSVVVNNENTAPTVNQVPVPVVTIQPPTPSVTDSPSKARFLGDCPICLDVISSDFIGSTNCGHVFCLDCIKRSLSTTGKRCPTCRKQLKGTGYHQVFL